MIASTQNFVGMRASMVFMQSSGLVVTYRDPQLLQLMPSSRRLVGLAALTP